MSHISIDDQTIENLVHASTALMNDYGYFTQCLWHVSDIHLLCEQRGWPPLSHEDAKAVFTIFAELYEGDQGLTWSKLEQATQVYLAKSGKIQQSQKRLQSLGSMDETFQAEECAHHHHVRELLARDTLREATSA